MTDIGIPEIIITDKIEDSDSITYVAKAKERPSYCTNPFCLFYREPNIHSKKYNRIRDVKSEGKPVFINLKITRYRCPKCGEIISDSFTFYEKKSHTTNRLKEEYRMRHRKGETYLSIATDYGVDHKTVAAACKADQN